MTRTRPPLARRTPTFARSLARVVAFAALLTLAAACEAENGGGGGDGGGGGATEPDPGEGTGTLEVVATVSAQEAVGGATRTDDLDTTLTVSVRRAGEPVVDAVVTFDTPSGVKPLATDEEAADGVYHGSHAGYHRVYDLAVEAGADRLTARVVGPRLHAITAPAVPREGGTLPPDGPIEVRWEPPEPAEAVLVRVGDYTADDLPDTGSHTVPADAGRGDVGRDLRVEVRRELRMGLAGGAAGSEAIARLRNRTPPARLCPSEGCPE